MNLVLNKKKTSSIILLVGGFIGLGAGITALLDGKIAVGIFLGAIGVYAFFELWKRKKAK